MGKFYSKKKNLSQRRKKSGKKQKRNVLESNSNQSKSKDPGCPKFGSNAKIEKKKKHVRHGKGIRSESEKSKSMKKTLPSMLSSAEKRTSEFLTASDDKLNGDNKSNLSQNFKKCYKEFRKVIEAADVIIEVLDARDPLGSRCKEVEQAVIDAGPDKRLILLINKIDLIPRENLEKWLKYLRQEFPTVAFKASTQSQNDNLSQSRVAAIHMNESLQSSSRCFGAKFLMKVLGNYCRSKDVLMSIKVGVVGFPNVGKSSIINSLKRCHACDTGSTPGITKIMQEITLDKHVRLLDCPGVVFAKEGSESSLALRNAIKIEKLEDLLAPAEAIIQRVDHSQLCDHYQVPAFSSVEELLFFLAKRIGRFKKGGVPDVDAAALKLINDWNNGVIRYYTHPPETYQPMIQISAEVVQEMSKAFDISMLMEEMELEEMEKDKESVKCEPQPDASETMEVASENTKDQNEMQDQSVKPDNEKASVSAKFSSKKKRKKRNASKSDEKDVDVLRFQKSKQQKQLFKKMKKKRRRNEKVASTLSATLDSALSMMQ